MKVKLKLLIGCLLLAKASFGQQLRDTIGRAKDSVPDAPQKKEKAFHFLGQSTDRAKAGKLIINPFIFPGYSPDIQYSIAGGAIMSFKTSQKDSLLPRSSIPITITYSTIHSFIASAGVTTFWLHDKLRINALIQYKVSRDAYYGIGYENALHTSFPDSTNFWRSFFIFQVRPQWKLRKHLFAGISLDYNQNVLWNVNRHMSKDPNYLQTGQYISNSGLGGIISYDSRDVPQNAYKGLYSALVYTFYTKDFGGNTNFRALDFDTRYFVPLSATKVRTLAINFRSRYDYGQVPFTSMISLGTSTDLRGFRFGQFRDYYLNYLITEFRYKIYKPDGKPTRFGFVAWTGLGAIGDDFRSGLFERALPDFGVGLRFEVQPRLNLRVDFGYAPAGGNHHTATYFNFLEAY